MKTPLTKIYDELVYKHPHKNMDCLDYHILANDMLNDKKHPAWRHISDKLKKELLKTNPQDNENKKGQDSRPAQTQEDGIPA
jgi:hypothetical protein